MRNLMTRPCLVCLCGGWDFLPRKLFFVLVLRIQRLGLRSWKQTEIACIWEIGSECSPKRVRKLSGSSGSCQKQLSLLWKVKEEVGMRFHMVSSWHRFWVVLQFFSAGPLGVNFSSLNYICISLSACIPRY